MTIDVYWRIPTHGDRQSFRVDGAGRGDWYPFVPGSSNPGLRDGEPDGLTYLDHMGDVARAAEAAGFAGGLLPSFPMTDDPWVISSALARETKTFRYMIAFQPGFAHPLHVARMAASLQRLSGGRTLFNIITGGGGPAQEWWGDPVAHDDRYARTAEFLTVLRGVWDGRPFTFDGRFFPVRDTALPPGLTDEEFPEIYFSGSSAAAIEAAGAHSDYYLSWLEPLDALRTKFEQVRERTEALGRKPKFAVRVDIAARPTSEQAWKEIQRGWELVDHEAVARMYSANGSRGDSVGAARQSQFSGGDTPRDHRDLIVSPNVWGGFSFLRGGPALSIVGSYEEAAERLDELIDIGVDAFILAGTPHLEEAYRVGEEVLPLLRSRPAADASPAAPADRPHQLTVA
jgi:alkanesulfonate monooxygenase